MKEASRGGLEAFDNSSALLAALNRIAGADSHLSGLEGLGVALAGESLKFPIGRQLSRIADALEMIAERMK